MNQSDMPMDYHVWDAMMERYQRYTPKLTNNAKLKDCVVYNYGIIYCNIKLIDIKAVVSFCSRLSSYVSGAGGHSKHSIQILSEL